MSEKNKQPVLWVCRKCGKQVRSKTKPGALYGSKCKASPAGAHSFVKG